MTKLIIVPTVLIDCFLIGVQGNEFVKEGCWDSIHIVEAVEESSSRATYKLTTTVILHMGVDREEVGCTTLSGTLTRQVRRFLFVFMIQRPCCLTDTYSQ